MKKLLLASALILTAALIMGCSTTPPAGFESSLASANNPFPLVLEDNFKWNEGYQGLLIDSRLLKGGKFTQGEEWKLDIAFTASRDLQSKLRVALVDGTEAANWWRTLSYKDVDSMSDMHMVVTDGLEKGQLVEASIPFYIYSNPTSNTPDANLVVFYADDDDGTKGVSNSGTKGNITLRFTKLTLTKLSDAPK
ncbi:MAG: hypothetical protein LBH43_05380 [Treponema sp.]|jgi:hypothetical protein|nr:hypothetical protein [Treponema sp.]